MTRKGDNDGIWIEGSATVIAGALAAGTGATAVGSTQYSGAPADLDELRDGARRARRAATVRPGRSRRPRVARRDRGRRRSERREEASRTSGS